MVKGTGEILVSAFESSRDVKSCLSTALLANFAVLLLLIIVVFLALAKDREVRYLVLRALGASRLYIGIVLWLGTACLMLGGVFFSIPLYYSVSSGLNAASQLRTGLVLQAGLGWYEVITVLIVLGGSLTMLAVSSWVFVRRDLPFDLLRQ